MTPQCTVRRSQSSYQRRRRTHTPALDLNLIKLPAAFVDMLFPNVLEFLILLKNTPLPSLVEVGITLGLLYFLVKRTKVFFFITLVLSLVLGRKFSGGGTVSVQLEVSKQSAAFFVKDPVGDPTPHGVRVSHDIPVPTSHGNHQMLIRVNGAGLNPSNFKVNMAKIPFIRHLKTHHVVGYDVVGTVVSVGSHENCAGFIAGDKIFGMASGGSIAQYTTILCSMASHAPKSLNHLQTAGLPVVALTSLEAFHRVGFKKGMRVLVIGASGGCGIFGVTIAKALGASHVAGICSGRNAEFVKNTLGADEVVNYRDPEALKTFIEQNKGSYDMVYDTVTSFAPEDPDYEPSMRPLLKAGTGKYKAINGSPLDWLRGIMDKFLGTPLFGAPGALQRENYDLFLLTPSRENLATIQSMFDKGRLTDAPLDQVFKLTESGVNSAFGRMKSRRAVGKIVFDMV